MNDIFKEQLVERKASKKDLMAKGGIVLGALMIIMIPLTVPMIAPFLFPVLVLVGFLAAFLLRRFNLEFEYIFTNGDLDIDKVINKGKRKHALTVSVKKFIIMAPLSKKEFEKEFTNFTKVMDYGKGVITETSYGAVFEQDGARVKLIFDPNDQMIEAIRTYIPRIVKK